MKLKALSVSCILSLIIIGCVSEFDAKLPLNDMQILIVDGSITEGEVTFHLSKSFPLDSSDVSNLDMEAKLTIIGSNGYQSPPAIKTERMVTKVINGKKKERKEAYWIAAVGELNDGVEYGIQIEYNGETYRSTLSKPLHTPEIDSISWIQPVEEGAIFFRISTHDNTEGSKFFLWSYTEDWESTATFPTSVFLDIYGSPGNPPRGYYSEDWAPFYYCWKKDTSKEILIGSTESLSENKIINQQFYEVDVADERFSVLYGITVSQKAITKGAYEYYQNKSKLNDEMGGLFTPQPFEVKGNITCITDPSKKVIGYIETVKNISQKRIFVSRKQITRQIIISTGSCVLIPHDSVPRYVSDYSTNIYRDFYKMGYRPAGAKNILTGKPETWATHSCTDCVEKGGSKDKPDFWPNDHR
jgi:hypothetical protein